MRFEFRRFGTPQNVAGPEIFTYLHSSRKNHGRGGQLGCGPNPAAAQDKEKRVWDTG